MAASPHSSNLKSLQRVELRSQLHEPALTSLASKKGPLLSRSAWYLQSLQGRLPHAQRSVPISE